MWLPPFGLFIGMVAFLLNMIALLVLVLTERLILADESPDEI